MRLRARESAARALTSRDGLRAGIRRSTARRDELVDGFAFDHLCVG
ncbi:hypothetical protein QTQ03_03940 [Micromonospora sp. WMMA1363]|nr:hypothetical protein [Micromonospora sp. WMMA1363]MDM4718787.1 hypothetical protein [Micromonospora sp. WMMA1363]